MRGSIAIATVLLTACSTDAAVAIPREVEFENGESIGLGSPLAESLDVSPADTMDWGTQPSGGSRLEVLAIPVGLFSGAQHVDVELDAEGLIDRIRLTYPPDHRFRQLIEPFELARGDQSREVGRDSSGLIRRSGRWHALSGVLREVGDTTSSRPATETSTVWFDAWTRLTTIYYYSRFVDPPGRARVWLQNVHRN